MQLQQDKFTLLKVRTEWLLLTWQSQVWDRFKLSAPQVRLFISVKNLNTYFKLILLFATFYLKLDAFNLS